MSRIERAAELATETRDILAGAAIDNVTVTLDPLEIPPALANGPVVAIQPPDLRFITYGAADADWELYVIAGPYSDRLAAWAVIDPIISALETPLNITTAKAANYEHASMPAYPAYVLALTETI